MGQVVGVITQAIGLGKQIKNEADRIKNRSLTKEASRLSNPIKPPEYWPNIRTRDKNVPTGPYSTIGIRESLKNEILPIGYSEEQLIQVGFEPEVTQYWIDVKNRENDIIDSFLNNLKAVIDGVKSIMNGSDEILKQSLIKAGVNNNLINKYSSVSKENISLDMINNMISEIQTYLSRADVIVNNIADVDRSNLMIEKAENERAESVMTIIQRALNNRVVKNVD